mgnify:CR=1 FL=1
MKDESLLLLFYFQFDGFKSSRTVKLLQAEKTPELMNYMDQINGVVNYVNQTFSLFNVVEKVRPKKLNKLKFAVRLWCLVLYG